MAVGRRSILFCCSGAAVLRLVLCMRVQESIYNTADVDSGTEFKPISRNMQLGPVGGALIPDLVPPPNLVYQFRIKDKIWAPQAALESRDANDYKWELSWIDNSMGETEYEVGQTLAKLKGNWKSNSFGHKSVDVCNALGKEMFTIRMAKHLWTPLRLRWSFRILPPGSKSNEDTLFTINRDVFGKGALWIKEEWRIYRGRKREKQMLYYCIGNHKNWDFKFYRSKEEFDSGNKVIVAEIEQKRGAGTISTHHFFPDKFKVKVYPGEDSALLLTVATIIDMVHDSTRVQGVVRNDPNYTELLEAFKKDRS